MEISSSSSIVDVLSKAIIPLFSMNFFSLIIIGGIIITVYTFMGYRRVRIAQVIGFFIAGYFLLNIFGITSSIIPPISPIPPMSESLPSSTQNLQVNSMYLNSTYNTTNNYTVNIPNKTTVFTDDLSLADLGDV